MHHTYREHYYTVLGACPNGAQAWQLGVWRILQTGAPGRGLIAAQSAARLGAVPLEVLVSSTAQHPLILQRKQQGSHAALVGYRHTHTHGTINSRWKGVRDQGPLFQCQAPCYKISEMNEPSGNHHNIHLSKQ